MTENSINITNFKGVLKQSLAFSEAEGKLKGMRIMNSYLIGFTVNNYFKIFDLSRREAKQIGINRRFEDSSGPLGEIRACYVNADASKVAILSDKKIGTVSNHDTCFYVYDVEMDSFMNYEMGSINILNNYFIKKILKFFFFPY